jgi:fused signal recognition particle receptor
MGFFKKFKEAWLASMTFDRLDDDFYEELEEALILADIGAATAADTVAQLRKRVSQKLLGRADEVKDALRDILAEKLDVGDPSMDLSTQPSVVLIIGVNGVGKTTSIGKLAARYKSEGKKVLLCAGDTFRAAAADQLEIWADRAGVDIVRQHEGADPGAVLFDALQAAKARNVDVVLCDTAGRLHNKQNLMNELAKLRKIIDREVPDAAKETLLQPPGKQLKTITLLSGGEKAFVAIALYFAILKVHPTPFCVMDEIEAALDEANVVRYARYMRRIAGRTQFIVITHRRGTMEEADVLYGVTMQEKGVSRILTINLNDMAKELKIK